ncbi:PKD domain-containing protein [Candidatus Woesearchaeota archaeon]|nr:PKD domain-containing protein [Candidatus Woesearchaeota archaeon]
MKLFIKILIVLNFVFLITSCATGNVIEENKVPLVNAGNDISVSVGEEFNFDGVASDPDGVIISYEWDANGDGVYDTYCGGCAKDSYVFDKAGIYTARLKVTDDDGGVAFDEITIVVEE